LANDILEWCPGWVQGLVSVNDIRDGWPSLSIIISLSDRRKGGIT